MFEYINPNVNCPKKGRQTVIYLKNQAITANALKNAIAQYTHTIAQLHANNIAIVCQQKYTFIIALMATLSAGKRPILLPNSKPETLKNFAHHYDHLINDQQVEYALSESANHNDLKQPLAIDELEEITLFTSGSTGQAKKITKSTRCIINEINAISQTFDFSMVKQLYTSVKPSHMYGLSFVIFLALINKIPIHNNNIQFIEDALASKPDSLFISTPSYLERLVDYIDTDTHHQLPTLIISAGAPLNLATALKLKNKGVQIIEIYGSTETGVVAYHTFSTPDKTQQKIWQTFHGVSLQQNKEDDCLIVTSSFFDHHIQPFQSADIVDFKDQNRFVLLGRKDRIVKLESIRLSLDEMENTLLTHPLVKDCSVMLCTKKRQFTRAVITLSPAGLQQQHENEQALKAAISKFLKQYYQDIVTPKEIFFVTALPRNAQGKLNQKKLEQLARVSYKVKA